MAQRTASEVAEMESEILILRSENEALRIQIAVAASERDQAKIELALITAASQEHLIRATQLETILQQAGSTITSGLAQMHAKKQAKAYFGKQTTFISETEFEHRLEGDDQAERERLEREVAEAHDLWRTTPDYQRQSQPGSLAREARSIQPSPLQTDDDPRLPNMGLKRDE